MKNTAKQQPASEVQTGLFNWFSRYEEGTDPALYQVNLPERDKAEENDSVR